jgi:Icc-related predicted phosphoesterase
VSVRVLAIADEESDALWGETLRDLKPDVIVACGDLPFEYLENLVSRTDKPLLYVPGNHDPELRPPGSIYAGMAASDEAVGPPGCESVDGRVSEAAGLRIAGLGGSVRYRPGPNQYSQREMAWRAFKLRTRVWLSRQPLDMLITHAPPAGYGDSDDPPHHGFSALVGLVEHLQPRLLIHGHVNTYGPKGKELTIGRTRLVNAIPFKLIEV